MQSRNSIFRDSILGPGLSFICESHNGLSAKIVQEAGFAGIWASGLSIAAQYGVRDNNEASWTQVLDMVEFMADATSIPILVDGDTGFGNFNNFRRFVQKLEQVGASGVCIEDKQFPKKNSFLDGKKQELADIKEFCGKIRAGKDSQRSNDFSIVARIEALIAGWGIDEALKRADAYAEAGADAILIHSAMKDASEIFEFLDRWEKKCPVVLVPTTYSNTATGEFESRDVNLVIWANQIIRSSIKSMSETAKIIYRDKSVSGLGEKLVPVSEIFRLQNNDELEFAESMYIPERQETHCVLLSGGNRDVRELLNVSGLKLEYYVSNYKRMGISKLHLVVDGQEESQTEHFDSVIRLPDRSKSEIETLSLAKDVVENTTGNLVISYADTIYDGSTIDFNRFSDSNLDAIVLCSYSHAQKVPTKKIYDCVSVSSSDTETFSSMMILKEIKSSNEVKIDTLIWSGLIFIPEKSRKAFLSALDNFINERTIQDGTIPDIVNNLVREGMTIGAKLTFAQWKEFGTKSIMVSSG